MTSVTQRPEAHEVWAYRLAVLIGVGVVSLLVGVVTSSLVSVVAPWDLSFWPFLLSAFAVFFALATPRGAALWHEAERRDELASLARRLVAHGWDCGLRAQDRSLVVLNLTTSAGGFSAVVKVPSGLTTDQVKKS